MKGRDRRQRFRAAVYAPRADMTNGCRVLLLRLADDMNANGVVSIPRSALAEEFGVAPARISENIKLARRLGFLGIVRRARPGVTAVYQGQIPAPEVRQSVPSAEVRKTEPLLVRQGVPLEAPQRYATAPTQVGNADCPSAGTRRGVVPDDDRGPNRTSDRAAVDGLPNGGSKEKSA